MILGLDSGSTTTKAVLFNGEIQDVKLIPTSHDPKRSVKELYEYYKADYVIVTGYGRNLLEASDKTITELSAHGKGAHYLHPKTRTIIDIGGQDSKVIEVNETGKLTNFIMNDKCAAGTGRFLDVLLKVLKTDFDSLGKFTKSALPTTISSMCTVFAESEVISMLAHEVPAPNIALGALHSIAKRTANFAKRLTIHSDVFFSGGLAQNKTLQDLLQTYLGEPIYTHELCQYVGALGAAVVGYEQSNR